MRTVSTNEALEITLTRERLEKYLRETHQDLDAAIKLYERNTKLSEAFYTPLQSLEICLRNSIHAALTSAYGEDWFQTQRGEFSAESSHMLFEAVDQLRKARRPVTPGAVVAELKFAFWVGLMGPGYDATLWRRVIYRAFLARGGKARSTVHGRFNAVRRFRNRIAHHEPIFNKALHETHNEIIDAIGWMCRDTSNWAAHQSRFEQVMAEQI